LRLLATQRVVEVVTSDGRRFVGALAQAPDRSIAVSTATGEVPLPMAQVVLITPIGGSFWKKLDGNVDAGFSYTRSSGIAQLNVNSQVVYRKPAFVARLTGSLTQTRQDDEDDSDDDRGSIEGSYLRYRWQERFVLVGARFETNESLGLELRSSVVAGLGARLINSIRGELAVGAGLGVNDERGVDVESTRNIEALFTFRTAYYTYDRPKTTFDMDMQYYPSLSNWGRQRVQLDAAIRQEIWKDLFVALTVYNTYDSRPPNPDANTNDVGIVTSIGWTF
jgi:putative salt-induced outer membrane protein YdiY